MGEETMAGYSPRTLSQKLGIKAGMRAALEFVVRLKDRDRGTPPHQVAALRDSLGPMESASLGRDNDRIGRGRRR
ncbi:MAG: hypothetical protein EXR49_07785 [Dehalococcoidia bacterium]|nr:hypothetical protein [Dehalococcoidia bacterium]